MIDQQNHHCFQPLLYQVATAALSPADIAWPIRHILRRQQNATVLMAEVTGIDTAERLVHTDRSACLTTIWCSRPARRIPISAMTNGPRWRPGLKRIEDATRIRRGAAARLRAGRDRGRRSRAAAAAHLRDRRRRRHRRRDGGRHRRDRAPDPGEGFPPYRSQASRIVLLEAGPRVMPTLPHNLSDYVQRTLARMGVEVMTSTRVDGCDARGVDLDRGRIDAGTIIWAAGVVASPAARWLAAEHDRAGRVQGRARSLGAAAMPKCS